MEIENPYEQYMYSYPHKTAYRALQGVHLKDYLGRLAGGENSLYFHIPFCQYKCGYCNLFSVANHTPQLMQGYVDAMERQAEQISKLLPADAVFSDLTLGGGTPLILPASMLRQVFAMARKYFGFQPSEHPVVVETSPNQTTEEKLDILKEEGVSRVSIGVQSFHEEELAALGRFHSVDSAKAALHSIKGKGFDCVNVDLIYGIPGQTVDSLTDSLRQALEFEPEELFVYPLYVKPETMLYKKGVKRSRDAFAMHRHVRDFLTEAGYQPHSMRRFVKLDHKGSFAGNGVDAGLQLPESLCGFGNTISVGCGGRSYIGNLHFCTPYAVRQGHCEEIIKDYLEREDYLTVTHGFILPLEEQKRRYVIKHILFGRGINRYDYRKYFSEDAEHTFPALREWEQLGYITMGEEFITLTEEGFALSDYLGPQLISAEVRAKSEEFYSG